MKFKDIEEDDLGDDEVVVVLVSVKALAKRFSQFDKTFWSGLETPITRREVEESILGEKFEESPVNDGTWMTDVLKGIPREESELKNRRMHIERVAFLVMNASDDPICVDVGMPGYEKELTMIDGFHRLAAAIYRNDEKIRLIWDGSWSYAKKYFLNCEVEIENEEILGQTTYNGM